MIRPSIFVPLQIVQIIFLTFQNKRMAELGKKRKLTDDESIAVDRETRDEIGSPPKKRETSDEIGSPPKKLEGSLPKNVQSVSSSLDRRGNSFVVEDDWSKERHDQDAFKECNDQDSSKERHDQYLLNERHDQDSSKERHDQIDPSLEELPDTLDHFATSKGSSFDHFATSKGPSSPRHDPGWTRAFPDDSRCQTDPNLDKEIPSFRSAGTFPSFPPSRFRSTGLNPIHFRQPLKVGEFSVDDRRRFRNDASAKKYYVHLDSKQPPNLDLRKGVIST